MSSEQVWTHAKREQKHMESQKEVSMQKWGDKHGDLKLFVKVYKAWKKDGCRDEFCRENSLNSRCLKQTTNII